MAVLLDDRQFPAVLSSNKRDATMQAASQVLFQLSSEAKREQVETTNLSLFSVDSLLDVDSERQVIDSIRSGRCNRLVDLLKIVSQRSSGIDRLQSPCRIRSWTNRSSRDDCH